MDKTSLWIRGAESGTDPRQESRIQAMDKTTLWKRGAESGMTHF
jgi:phosphoribosyl-AMP cyclohydrolase